MFNREKVEVKRVPMMPVRDMVIFPEMMHPFIVGREASVRALEEALAGDKRIFLATQHDASVDDPKPEEIYQVGTLANIVQSVKLPDGNIKVLVEGTERARIVQVANDEGFFRATIRLAPVRPESGTETKQAGERVTGLFEQTPIDLVALHHVRSYNEISKLPLCRHVVHHFQHQVLEDHAQAAGANFAL